MRPFCVTALALAGLGTVYARPEPRSLIGEGWTDRNGMDGNWSTTELWVGNVDVSEATMNLIISTTLSETWVVGSGGCVDREQLCPKYRGGTLDIWASNTWYSLGDWQLSFPYRDVEANGNYGLDTLVIRDPQTKTLVALDRALIAAFNTTEFYNGFFGLGIVSGEFGHQVSEAPFSQMVAKYGWFPSYTYGYTAGAYYKGSGTPSSLVLGGYDEKRFVPHGVEFTLTRDTILPQALVRGIEVSVPGDKNPPDHWESNTFVLSNMNTSFQAIIDSSTPFLWLPQAVCDNFVRALNLTRSDKLDAYELTNDQYGQLKAGDSFTFTFSLSSYDNNDDFGHPLDVSGVVNITLSAHAFAHTLQYPWNNMAIEYGQQGIPYFPIKVAPDNTFILGRTFLQEAYLLTKYDSTVFSIHQALYPESPLDSEIVAVEQPPNSAYPPPSDTGDRHGLSKNQMIGIVAGVVVATLIALFIFCFCCRRRRKRTRVPKAYTEDDPKDAASSIMTETPKTPVARIFSKIIRKKRSRKAESVEASGTEANPAEVGADATHELYELPAPLGPVELDADTNSIISETELGTEGTENVSAYELARRKMERRLQGPVPAYSPPAESTADLGGEASTRDKTMQDISPVETYRPSDHVSPTSSPTYANTDSLPQSLPSPMSPRGDWNLRNGDMPSPMTIPPSLPSPTYAAGTGRSGTVSSHSHTYDPSSLSRSSSGNDVSPTSPSSAGPNPSKVQRTPIDPSKIICLGPLPENVQLPLPSPSRSIIPHTPGPESRSPGLLVMSNPEAGVSTDTLGSNFTDVEELAHDVPNISDPDPPTQSPVSPVLPAHPDVSNHNLESPRSLERIDAGNELVHVPQLAERRYSWEEER
ncbi:hypothetical protein jhhlp_003662 [Lomentospora prolificans]|uniref:Peptidase A1 domain-containing protein n=1 Tax=Lomentospora prolificans TaxID=41688 RepID=A0A2N3N9C8_9PEZI|nr:hypothetical protein jhhlp_003662 [Lomentospora prolificans]